MIIFCERGAEELLISRIRQMLEQGNVKSMDTCIGFTWEKMDTTPFYLQNCWLHHENLSLTTKIKEYRVLLRHQSFPEA